MTAGKGDTPRPIANAMTFASNWDLVFGKSKLQKAIKDEWDKCPYCGFRMENPCDVPPSAYCSAALDKMYEKGTND